MQEVFTQGTAPTRRIEDEENPDETKRGIPLQKLFPLRKKKPPLCL